MRSLLLALAMICWTLPAIAAPDTGGIPDEDFTSSNFGTIASFHAPRQLVDPNVSWWGEKLHPQLSGEPAYLVGLINAKRMDKGLPLLDPNEYPIIPMNELVEGSGYAYTIEFVGIRPSEVDAVIGMLGGPAQVLPGSERVSYAPLRHRGFNLYSDNGAPLTVYVGNDPVVIENSASFEQVYTLLQSAFRRSFGQDVVIELTLSDSQYRDGPRSRSVSIYADMDYTSAEAYDPSMEATEEYDG